MSTAGEAYVVQRGMAYLRLDGVFEYPRFVPYPEDATAVSYAKGHQLAAHLGGSVIAVEIRVQAPKPEPEAVATFAPPTLPSGTAEIPSPFAAYAFEEQ